VADWFSSTVNSIGELKQTRRELEEYKEKLITYERIAREGMQLRQEIQRLEELLGFSREVAFENIPAEVIARQPGNVFSLITLNKGAKDGVRRYMPVVAQHRGLSGLVGKTITVSARSCTVLPILNQESFVAARLEKSRYEGIVNGKGEFSDLLSMQNVKKIAVREIQYGDMVITSGLGRLFPRGIPIGRIRSITSRAEETSIELMVEPAIDFTRLEQVLILDTDTEE
jgi:rod shape-determining protein MreC